MVPLRKLIRSARDSLMEDQLSEGRSNKAVKVDHYVNAMLRAPRSAAASSVAVLRRPHQKKPQGRLSTCKSNCGDDWWRRLIWQAYPTAFLRPVTCWAPCWVMSLCFFWRHSPKKLWAPPHEGWELRPWGPRASRFRGLLAVPVGLGLMHAELFDMNRACGVISWTSGLMLHYRKLFNIQGWF